jgi:hypothetical protein
VKVSSTSDTENHGSQESRELNTAVLQDHPNTKPLNRSNQSKHENGFTRSTGFVEGHYGVQELQAITAAKVERAVEELEKMTPQQRGSYAPRSEHIIPSDFSAEDKNVNIGHSVDPYEMPAPETAGRLFTCYMAKVHDSFPILPRKTFERQFREYFTELQDGNVPYLNLKWQSTVNLVFAIGARYSHLTKASWRANEQDHLTYQIRARALGLDECAITTHPDVPQIQALGLLAFYWLCIGHINR